MNEETEDAARELAKKASEPGAFTFLDRLLGRNYPTDEVVIYLDEAAGYKVSELRRKAKMSADPETAAAIEEQIDALDREVVKSAAIFRLQGMPNEEYDAIIDDIYEQMPAEYEETTNPFTGRKEKTEIHDPKREDLLNTTVWARFLTEIETSEGTQRGFTEDEAAVMRGKLPIDGVRRVQEVIQKLRMATSWMDQIQDEGFLAGR